MVRNMDYQVFYSIPGKSNADGSYLPLWIHLEDTAFVTEYLCSGRVSDSIVSACGVERSIFIRTAVFLAMVHDIGKCTPVFAAKISTQIAFQRKKLLDLGLEIPSVSAFIDASKSPHARAGEAILLSERFPCGICSIVGAHHGKPTDQAEYTNDQLDLYSLNYGYRQKAQWDALRKQIIQNALARAGFRDCSELPHLSKTAQMLLCGLLIEADWIASNQSYFPLLAADEKPDEVYPSTRAEMAISLLSLPDCWKPQAVPMEVDQLYTEHFGFSPNLMQECAVKVSQSLYGGELILIEAQMGSGKTEAALVSAEILASRTGSSGVFFGLPTQATSNGLFPRLAEWATQLSADSRHTIRLVHGMAELNEEYQRFFNGKTVTDDDGDSGLLAHEWFSGKKQALLADFVVGTVDTALMAALSQKHIMLRHLGLCGKVVIIDEVHAYDAYMSRYLGRMLEWLGAYHVPVILLSATLPQNKKKDMLRAYTGNSKLQLPAQTGYPLITWTNNGAVHTEAVPNEAKGKRIQIRRLDETEITDDIRSRIRDGGCVGVIVNTVRRAQMLAERLQKEFPEKCVILHHAQFLANDRIRREKQLMKRIGKSSTAEERNGFIVVGTQVLEQSLDIDFDYLITDLCPIDLLLQRIGRLQRHKRERPGAMQTACCSVICDSEGFETGAKSIYGQWLLSQTRKCLPTQICIPEDIPKLVESVYSAESDDPSDKAWEEYQDRIKKEERRAGVWLLKKPSASRYEIRNSLVGLLEHPIENEKHAEASVRDASPSVDVLVMRNVDKDHLGFLPWVSSDKLRKDCVPSAEEAKKVAMQRLRLPYALCIGKQLDAVIDCLEKENRRRLPLWQQSEWLKGELILMLDENGERELCGYHIRYEKEFGFRYERRED